jgi:hypothetical protein
MRVLLMSLLMIPLAIGCLHEKEEKPTADDWPDADADTDADADLGAVVCNEPPEIIHDTVDGIQHIVGGEVLLTADVITDPTEGCDTNVLVVEFYYKQQTDEEFGPAVSMSTVDGMEYRYRGSIPGPAVGSSTMRYYFMAVDSEGAVTIDPPGADTKDIKAYAFVR